VVAWANVEGVAGLAQVVGAGVVGAGHGLWGGVVGSEVVVEEVEVVQVVARVVVRVGHWVVVAEVGEETVVGGMVVASEMEAAAGVVLLVHLVGVGVVEDWVVAVAMVMAGAVAA
jgi:hypothetical protein